MVRLGLGVRGKLFAISLLLVVVAVAVTGIYLEGGLRTSLETRVEADLLARARGAAVALEHLPTSEIDALTDRIAEAFQARVSVIAPDGGVHGDSLFDGAQLAALENHANRPEVIAARQDGQGVAYRYSTTAQTQLLYAAIRRGTAGDVIRVAVPVDQLASSMAHLRSLLLVAGLLGLGAAVFMTGLASHLMARELRRLVHTVRARRVADPEAQEGPRDELAWLAGSFGRLERELSQTVNDLSTERDRLGTVLAAMSDALLALDEGLVVTVANPAAITHLGLDASPVGQSLIATLRAPALVGLARAGLATPTTGEIELPPPDRRRMLVQATPLTGGSGVVILLHDVTEVRRLETVRRDFVANVSHELRTPVAVVRSNAETLLRGALDDAPAARRFTGAILRNAERLSQLIADLLDLSRIESGQIELVLQPVEVTRAAALVVEALGPIAEARAHSVVVEVPADLRAVADPTALEQVLTNLLDNALKYTPQGGRIMIRGGLEDGRVRIEVIDNGPGIAAEQRERLFERFYRVDAGRSRAMGGTGLGLAIVKHLVEAMDGRLGVAAADPRGSRFWLELPSA